MKTRKEIKEASLSELEGKWNGPILATLILALIILIFGAPVFYTSFKEVLTATHLAKGELFQAIYNLAVLLIISPIAFSFLIAFLEFIRGDKEVMPSGIFNCFKRGNYGRSIIIPLLVNIFIALWSLLLIIPGIVKTYAYAMTYYIAHDNPDLGPNDCINASREMMHGHKWDLFVLDLSFIGWAFLCILTGGIGFLWLNPYISTARAIFYENLKAESNLSFQVEEDEDDEI